MLKTGCSDVEAIRAVLDTQKVQCVGACVRYEWRVPNALEALCVKETGKKCGS